MDNADENGRLWWRGAEAAALNETLSPVLQRRVYARFD